MADAIAGALARPLGAPALDRFVEPGDRVAVLQDESMPLEIRALAARAIDEALSRAGPDRVVRIALDLEARRDESWAAIGRVSGVGVVRLQADAARADKLVLVGGAGAPLRSGPGALASFGASDAQTRAALARLPSADFADASEAILLLAPPAFELHLVLQGAARLTGVLAGDPRSVWEARVRAG